MIITRLSGGLGNQLFQYAAGRRLAEKHSTNLKLDISDLQRAETRRYYCLNHFDIRAEIATQKETSQVDRIDTSFKKRLLWNIRYWLGKNPLYFLREKKVSFESRVLNAPDNTYLHGHWQTERYFKDIEDIIRSEFKVKSSQAGTNAEMAKKIVESNSISIHIRRTDYVSSESFKKIYNVCDLDYYNRGIKTLSTFVHNPTFIIFSDDMAWVKVNLHIPFPTLFVDINDDSTNYEDLRLMSQCKHNIIANSTFSWWGAWLNKNPGKIVIAPKRWFGVDKWNTKDIIPANWIKI